MNNKILIAIIGIIVFVSIGGYYFLSSRSTPSTSQGHNMEDMGGRPAAQSQRGYELEVTSSTSGIQPDKQTKITYRIKNDKGEIVKNYETVHEKIMHFITVRKDLAYFQHIHPDFNEATGEFTVEIIFPEDGLYRIFPDFTPGDENPQMLPVTLSHDIEVGDFAAYAEQKVVPDSEQTKTYGDYQVATTFPGDLIKQKEVTYTLQITKAGKPVTNLENYLGALGHSVILKEGTLDFIHTHALKSTDDSSMKGHAMDSMQGSATGTGPEISFATNFPESGIYRVFTQFQHEGEVQTVDYTVKIQ